MKKILLACLLALMAPFCFGQSYPSPTYNNLTVVGTFTATGKVTTADLATQAANTVLANVTASTASPTAATLPSCSTASSALNYTSGTGFTCNTAINAGTLLGGTWASPGAIGSSTPNSGAFTTLSASTTNPSLTYTNSGTGAVARNYQAKLADWLSVKDFGATGNGSTNDTAAEQAAITAACVAGGGVVYYPPGTYLTTAGSISIGCNGLYIVGAGPGSGGVGTIISTASTTGVLFPFSAVTGNGISNLTILYTATPTAGSAVTTNNASSFVMDNVIVNGAFNPISVLGGAGVPQFFSRLSLINTVTGGTGIYINGGNDQFFENMLIYSPSTIPVAGIHIQYTGGVWISNMDAVHNQYGLLIDPPNGSTVSFLSVHDADFDTSTADAIYFNPATGGTVYVCDFTDVWTASSTNIGVHISSAGGTVNGLRFLGQRAVNNGQDGFNITQPSGTVTNISISDSDISGNSQTSSGTSNGVTIGAGVSGFSITGSRIGPEGAFANTQSYGINISAGSSNNYVVQGNNLTGNVTGGMTDGGTGTTKLIKGNIGYNPLTQAITVGASPFTYTNNTGEAATVIIAGGTVSLVTLSGLAVATATNTSIVIPQGKSLTVTYSATPTMSLQGF